MPPRFHCTPPEAVAETVRETVFVGDMVNNQAILVAGGPVQVFSSGYRNPYDIVLTSSGRTGSLMEGLSQKAEAGRRAWSGPTPGEGSSCHHGACGCGRLE